MTAPAARREPVVVPMGVWALGLLLIAVPFLRHWPWPVSPVGERVASIVRLLIEAGALVLAARAGAPARIRQVLLGLALISAVSAASSGAGFLVDGYSTSPPARLWHLLGYVLAAMLFLRWPRVPGVGHRVTLVIDTVITAGGLGMLMWVFMVVPYQGGGTGSLLRWLMGSGEVEVVAQVAQIDTGVGIDPDALRQIFQPFFSSRPQHAASGLGLAAVYGIVVAHGGGLGVTSAPGQGTRITVRWPVAAPPRA